MCRDVTTSSTKWIDNAQLQTGMIAMRLRRGNPLNAAPEMQLLFRNKGRIGDSQTFKKMQLHNQHYCQRGSGVNLNTLIRVCAEMRSK